MGWRLVSAWQTVRFRRTVCQAIVNELLFDDLVLAKHQTANSIGAVRGVGLGRRRRRWDEIDGS